MAKEQIYNILNHFAAKLAVDLKRSLERVLNKADSSKIELDDNVKLKSDEIKVTVSSNVDYWYWIEKGRKPTQSSTGSGAVRKGVGKKWQVSVGIDPREVIYDLTVKYNKKKGFERNVKRLSYDKAAKQLSYIIARKIHKHGYKPRPFRDKVLDDGRFDKLGKDLSEAMGKEITATLNFD